MFWDEHLDLYIDGAININLYNNVLGFAAGETISGTIDIEIAKPFDAVDLVVKVHGEGNTVKALVANAAAETPRVERLADRLENALHDQMTAYPTFLRGLLETGVEVVFLAVDLPIDIVERLSTKSAAT